MIISGSFSPFFVQSLENYIQYRHAYMQFYRQMVDYHSHCCNANKVSINEMMDLIYLGEKIAKDLPNRLALIKNGNQEERCTDKDACALAWYLTAQAVIENEGYLHGMRLVPGKEIVDFLSSHPECYYRVSTHYTESSNRWTHRGLDLAHMGLPARKRTILFSIRHDSTFIKLEEHGCPPIWKKKYRSLKHFNEFIGHTIDYICTRFIVRLVVSIAQKILFKSNSNIIYEELTEENIHGQLMHHFTATVNKMDLQPSYKKAILKEGKTHGLHRMYEILTHLRIYLPESEQERAIHPLLEQRIQKDLKRGLLHLRRKGSEVILPLDTSFSLFQLQLNTN